MDFASILTALWGKISKPLPNILVGLVFVFLASTSIRWAGYIFMAIGVASAAEWFYTRYEIWRAKKVLCVKLEALPVSEFHLLNHVRLNGGLSFSMANLDPANIEKQQTLYRLEAQRLVECSRYTTYRASGYTFTVPHDVAAALKDLIESRSDPRNERPLIAPQNAQR